MLSWSGNEQGVEIDLVSARDATGGANVKFARELLNFATAATELDGVALDKARNALIASAGVAITVDTAAVIANFEMMTRLADSTGARMPEEVVANRLSVATTMGVDQVVSRR
ncbi:MAG: hypothetical protein O3A62_06865 [Actinomycetota bacterium]|nr:hypothetical protein [Actinomycetota bacterium]